MYEVDDKDRVVTLQGIPQSSVGAPEPVIIANEHRAVLAYRVQSAEIWDEKTVRIDDPEGKEPIALVRLECHAHMFGPPNDEAFEGHPLAGRGLHPYGAFRIEDSSWIRKLERMNRVHPSHEPRRFHILQHLVFAFHDSTFECVCEQYDVRTERGIVVLDVLPVMLALLEEGR
jgi:hypothetical protein